MLILITHAEYVFKTYINHKQTFTKQYLNFSSYHLYSVKEIVHCLQHQTKLISGDTDAYQEMFSIRNAYQGNNYSASIISAMLMKISVHAYEKHGQIIQGQQ